MLFPYTYRNRIFFMLYINHITGAEPALLRKKIVALISLFQYILLSLL